MGQRTPDQVHFGEDTRPAAVPLQAELTVVRVTGDHDLPVLTLRDAA